MLSKIVRSGTSFQDFGKITLGTTKEMTQNWSSYTYNVGKLDAERLISLFGVPLTGINADLEYFVSFNVFNHPFIFYGEDDFTFNNFSLNGIDKLPGSTLIPFRYKFYVYIGMNSETWAYTFFGQNKEGYRKQDLWRMLGIDVSTEHDVGWHALRVKSQDPFSKEWVTYVGLHPEITINVPNLLGISLLDLQKYIGGTRKEDKITGAEYIVDFDNFLPCFSAVYNSAAYSESLRYQKELNNLLVYNQIEIPDTSYWCPYYNLPFGYMVALLNEWKVGVEMNIPVYTSEDKLNVLTAPLTPICITYRESASVVSNYGQCIYFIFPLIERVYR